MNVIVTGASGGIGFELVKQFLNQGHSVIAISRNIKPLVNLKHKHLIPVSIDLTKVEEIGKIISIIRDNFKRIDIVINNAGKLISKPFLETSYSDFLELYNVNVFGVVELTKVLFPYLSKGSHVVNISSMGGIQGSLKFAGLSAYSSSKGALITLTELLAEEFKESGIAFNVLALGAVQTEMLAKAFRDYKAPTTAQEMAAFIVNFALTGNQYFNGKILQVSNSTP